eukprot:gene392-494_t
MSNQQTQHQQYYGVGSINKQYVALLGAELVQSFINWSFLVEFISVIWFYPMGFMGFTGWEAALLAIFSPILLGIGFVNRFVTRNNLYIRLVGQLIGFFAIYPYLIVKENISKDSFAVFSNPHVTKTFFISVAIGIDWLAQCNRFLVRPSTTGVQSSPYSRHERGVFAYALAVVLHAVIRLPYISINPFMTYWNWIIFGIILTVGWFVVLIGEQTGSSSSSSSSSGVLHVSEPSSPLFTGIGLGGLIFTNQLLFSTYGLIPRWVDFGPFPAGLLVIFGLMVGTAMNRKRELVTSTNYQIIAGVAATVFGLCSGSYALPIGFVGLVSGAYLGIYVSSLWLTVIGKVANTEKPGRLFLSTMITYTVLLFWAIYVVSYKFIPWWLGSNLLRERHQTLILACILSIVIGIYYKGNKGLGSPKKDRSSKEPTYPNRETFNFLFALGVLMLLFSVNRAITHPTQASVAGHHYQRNLTQTSVELTAPKEIKSMIWTIHFGYDNFGRNSFSNITEAIASHGANVIGLLESDLSRVMTSNRDLLEYLASELHMHSDFGPAPSENTWGCALLSVFPIESSKHIILPSPEGELACLIDAVIRVDDTPVNIIVTHFGNTEDVEDRRLQAEGAHDIVKANNMPTVFLSYITEKTGGDNYKKIRSSGLEDTTNERRYCQYIFFKDLEMTKFQRWGCGDISDTEAQLAHFKPKKNI